MNQGWNLGVTIVGIGLTRSFQKYLTHATADLCLETACVERAASWHDSPTCGYVYTLKNFIRSMPAGGRVNADTVPVRCILFQLHRSLHPRIAFIGIDYDLNLG